MPQIPRLPTGSINTNAVDLAQGPSIARSDIATQAWGQLGGVVANIGADLMAKRKQAETSSYINTRKNELNRLVTEKETELESKYTGDPSGYASEMNEFLNSYGEEHLDSAPNSDAKQMWQEQFSSYSNDIGLKAQVKEDRNRAIYQSGLIDQDVYKNRQVLAQKPDSALASDFLTNSLASINDGVGLYYNETEAEERKRKVGAEYAGTLLEGFENSKRYGAGLRFLDGKDPAGKAVLEYTDPKQIQAYKDRFSRLAQQEAEISKRVLNSKVSDITSYLMDGNKIEESQLNELYSQVNTLEGEEKNILLDNLNNAKQYNSILQDVKTMSVAEIKKVAAFQVPSEEGDSFNYNTRQKMAEMYQKAAINILNKKESDGASFAIENDNNIKSLSIQATDLNDIEAMKTYSTVVTEKQKLDGITNTKLLDKNMSEKYGALLKAKNPEAAFYAFSNLKTGYGDNFGKVVSELIERKAIEPEYAMAMSLSDNDSIKKSFANIQNKKTLAESWAKIGNKSEINDLYTDERVADFKRSLAINDPYQTNLWVGEGVDNLVKIEYQSLRADGMSHSEAKDLSISNVMDKNIAIAKSKNSSVIMIGKYKDHKSHIEDFMTESLRRENLTKYNLDVPSSYRKDLELAGEDNPEEYFAKDLSKNGVWLTTSSQEGARLVLKTSKGYAEVKDKNGKPIEIGFQDMINTDVEQLVPYAYRSGF